MPLPSLRGPECRALERTAASEQAKKTTRPWLDWPFFDARASSISRKMKPKKGSTRLHLDNCSRHDCTSSVHLSLQPRASATPPPVHRRQRSQDGPLAACACGERALGKARRAHLCRRTHRAPGGTSCPSRSRCASAVGKRARGESVYVRRRGLLRRPRLSPSAAFHWVSSRKALLKPLAFVSCVHDPVCNATRVTGTCVVTPKPRAPAGPGRSRRKHAFRSCASRPPKVPRPSAPRPRNAKSITFRHLAVHCASVRRSCRHFYWPTWRLRQIYVTASGAARPHPGRRPATVLRAAHQPHAPARHTTPVRRSSHALSPACRPTNATRRRPAPAEVCDTARRHAAIGLIESVLSRIGAWAHKSAHFPQCTSTIVHFLANE